jgi:serine/threonine-protein kinase
MQVISSEDLIQALRGSGLFTPEQSEEIVQELAPLGTDANAMMRQLVLTDRLTRYQLKKVVYGKAVELLIGPYIITEKLGEGGMGKVYQARRLEGNKETIALKVVRAALVANPVVRGRYAREVQTAGTLDHPNIVRLYDAGEANGKFYLAMEFVNGIDLARLMRDFGKVEVTEACEYARQIALGLQHAHDKGFVHRDIKPSNIVVAGERHLPQATEPAVVKILDLGLARAIDPDDMVVPNLTRDHTVVGTPDYMAPEQAKNSKRVDPRSDLYSLGCAMYFLLTGNVPFPRLGPIEKIIAHQTQEPVPIQKLRPDVPSAVVKLVARLMTKNPDDRIQTASELAKLLEPLSRYPDNAAPVEITVRDSNLHDIAPPSPVTSAEAPSSASMAGPLTLLELQDSEDTPRKPLPKPVAPSDRTPRPKGEVPKSDRSPGKKKKPQSFAQKKHKHKQKRKPKAPAPPQQTSQFVWITVAILGIVLLGLMLWIVTHMP